MLSVPHLVIIFLVALIVFGPEKLPELARTLGRAMSEFKRATSDLRAGFDEHMRELERETSIREAQRSPAPPPCTTASPELTAAAAPEHAAEPAPPELQEAVPEAHSTTQEQEMEAAVPETVAKKASDGDI